MKNKIESLESFKANGLSDSFASNVLGGECTGGGFMQSPKTGGTWFTWTADDTSGDTTTYTGWGDAIGVKPPSTGQQ
jgi:hypothetical protein